MRAVKRVVDMRLRASARYDVAFSCRRSCDALRAPVLAYRLAFATCTGIALFGAGAFYRLRRCIGHFAVQENMSKF